MKNSNSNIKSIKVEHFIIEWSSERRESKHCEIDPSQLGSLLGDSIATSMFVF